MISMKKSAGIVFIYDNKILLVHPTNAPWYGIFGIPKGLVETGETLFDAAAREVKEEIGLDYYKLDKEKINREVKEIDYTDKKGKIYKRVYYYVVHLKSIEHEIIPKENLQLEEVDWAGFLNYEEASKKIFWRFNEILNYIK